MGEPAPLESGFGGALRSVCVDGAPESPTRSNEYGNDWAHDLFCSIADFDSLPGNCKSGQDGTFLRAGGAVLKQRELIETYAFVYDVRKMAEYILNFGPMVFACQWRTGMDQLNGRGFVEVAGRVRGGHAILLDEVKWEPSGESYFGFANSWGTRWGNNGRGKISDYGMQRLTEGDRGTACTAVEPPKRDPKQITPLGDAAENPAGTPPAPPDSIEVG